MYSFYFPLPKRIFLWKDVNLRPLCVYSTAQGMESFYYYRNKHFKNSYQDTSKSRIQCRVVIESDNAFL